jgi:hypothetical protein
MKSLYALRCIGNQHLAGHGIVIRLLFDGLIYYELELAS